MKRLLILTVLCLLTLCLPVFAQSDRPTLRNNPAQTNCGGRTANPRGPQDALTPYLISPRNTLVMSDRPSFRWNAVAGVRRYDVKLMNGETIVWQKQTNTNSMQYPAEVESLRAGIDYTLTIQGGERSAIETTIPTFRLLPASEVTLIQQSASLFTSQPLTESSALLQANLYIGSSLFENAIATLETLATQGTQSSTIYRQLGNLYDRAGLSLLAELRYLKAIDLATGNLEEEALLQSALGNLYVAIDESREAIRWLTQAKESYTQLNNQYQVNAISDRLEQLVR